MLQKLLASKALATTYIICLLCAVLAIASGASTRSVTQRSFAASERLKNLHLQADAVVVYQLDEETGIRGYVVTHDAALLQPYYVGAQKLRSALIQLTSALESEHIVAAVAHSRRAAVLNARWHAAVATPLLLHRHHKRGEFAVLHHGKALMDAFRSEMAGVTTAINQKEQATAEQTSQSIDRIDALVTILVGLILVGGVIFIGYQHSARRRLHLSHRRLHNVGEHAAQLRTAYEVERRIAERLQDAIGQRPLPVMPSLSFSAMYVPATEETKVGGDWYDAFELPGGRVLFAIGDVAGHGIDAAVTMSHARQFLASSALRADDPAKVLQQVNEQLIQSDAPMVTAIAGYADPNTYEFAFAVAGHPPPILLEPGNAPRMLTYGDPPLGVIAGGNFTMQRVQAGPGAMLVLYTDGAVEHSRDVLEGETLLLNAAGAAMKNNAKEPAKAIHDSIFDNRTVGDDVAILTISFDAQHHIGVALSVDHTYASLITS